MNKQTTPIQAVDAQERWLYRTGAISAVVLVVGYFLTFPVFAAVGAQPESLEARLPYFAQQATGWWVIAGLMIFTDLLYVPVWLALYRALGKIDRNVTLLALACIGLFVVLDLAVTWTSYGSLIILGGQYVAATTDAQQAVYLAAAGYPSAILDSPPSHVYAILIPSLGILLGSLVMLKGNVGKVTAYLGLAVGISGIVAVAGPYLSSALDNVFYLNAWLATFWYLALAWKLFRLGREHAQ